MIRLCILAFGAFALSQTPTVERLTADVRDFRERQYVVGQRIGCQIQFAQAVSAQDLDAATALGKRCERLQRRQNQS